MTTPAVKLLVSDVYRAGLNVWCFALTKDRLRQFPTGQILSSDHGTAPIRDEYPFNDDGVPTVVIQHDNNEGNKKKTYRIDEILIVEDIKSDDVIDTISFGIDTIHRVNQAEVSAVFSRCQGPPDGDQPTEYRDNVVERCIRRKKAVFSELRKVIIRANVDGYPHDTVEDGMERIPTELYDNLWAAIDHKMRESERIVKLIDDGVLTRYQAPQSDLPENIPAAFSQFLKHHEEAQHNMKPGKHQVIMNTAHSTEAVAKAPQPAGRTKESIPIARQQPEERKKTPTQPSDEDDERKPPPRSLPIDQQDELEEIDMNADTPTEYLPRHRVADKMHPEIEPSNLPRMNELRTLYDNLQPFFAGMYDIAEDADPRGPLLSYATWIIYLVAAGTQGRSKLNDKEWIVIKNEFLRPYNYGIQTAMAYHFHADPGHIENNDSSRRKAMTYVSAAMNTLLSGAIGLLDDDIRNKFDSTIRAASTGTASSSSVINDLQEFVKRENTNTVLPESVVGWMRCGHFIGNHVNKTPTSRVNPPPGPRARKRQPSGQQSGAKHTSTKKGGYTTDKLIDLTAKDDKRPVVDTSLTSPIPKKIRVTYEAGTPDNERNKPTNEASESPATMDNEAVKPPPTNDATDDTVTTTTKKMHPSGKAWKPPTSADHDFGPPGYIRVSPYLYVKGHRMVRSRFDEWERIVSEHNAVFTTHIVEVKQHAESKGLDPGEPFFPVDHASQLCYLHPVVFGLYRSAIPVGADIDLAHAASFCTNFAATHSNTTRTHQSFFGRSERSILSHAVLPVDESNLTRVYKHPEKLQRELDNLRASWFMPSLQK
jgi:hypothetical protein